MEYLTTPNKGCQSWNCWKVFRKRSVKMYKWRSHVVQVVWKQSLLVCLKKIYSSLRMKAPSAPPTCKCVPHWHIVPAPIFIKDIKRKSSLRKLSTKLVRMKVSPGPPTCKCVPLCPCPTSPSLMTFGIWHRFNKSQHFLSAHLLERSVQLCKNNMFSKSPKRKIDIEQITFHTTCMNVPMTLIIII